jgi:hypothetical protein
MPSTRIDRELRAEILATVRAATQQAQEENQEVWLSKEQLLAQFGFLSESWLRRYGHTLPRTKAVVVDEDGTRHETGFAYPRNKIQKMIRNNEIKNLCLKKSTSIRTASAL